MSNPIQNATQAISQGIEQLFAPLSESLITPLRTAFLAREPRERWLIVICAIFIAVFGWYKLIQQPLQQEYQRYSERNASNAETLLWMRGAAAQIRAQGGAANTTNNNGSLLSLADGSLRRSGLSAAIQRIQPDDENNVKIWLDNAKFDSLPAGLRKWKIKACISAWRVLHRLAAKTKPDLPMPALR